MPLVLDLPFGFSIDLSFWEKVLSWSTWEKISALFSTIGWPFMVLIFFYLLINMHRWYKNVQQMHGWTWVLLAIDIPQEILQGPKAVEHIFANLHGSALYTNLSEEYWQGKYQKWFSFEIVSIEGYIQFLVRTEKEYRDLVEAAIYAQYPEAEITEVEDYVSGIPAHYPDDQYNIMGWEFTLQNKDVYPIRTYSEFEHSISKDVVFNDPMAGMLENFTRIGPGENFWFHIIIMPSTHEAEWKEEGIEEAKEIIAKQGEEHHHDSTLSKIGDIPRKLAKEALNVWHWNWEGEESHAAHDESRPGSMMDLMPGMRDTVQSIEEKISKQAFKTKIRVLYAAKKEVFNVHKCMEGFIGSMKQFFNSSRNGFKPVHFTHASYVFAEYRAKLKKNHFMYAFNNRKPKMGSNPIMLNVEELATIWHFPLAFVKTPLLQKSTHKRAEPPIDLPLDVPGLPLMQEPEHKNVDLATDANQPLTGADVDGFKTDQTVTDQSIFNKDLPYG